MAFSIRKLYKNLVPQFEAFHTVQINESVTIIDIFDIKPSSHKHFHILKSLLSPINILVKFLNFFIVEISSPCEKAIKAFFSFEWPIRQHAVFQSGFLAGKVISSLSHLMNHCHEHQYRAL